MLFVTLLITVVFVYALASNLNLNVLHQNVTQPVQPTETLVGAHSHGGQGHAQVHAVDQITITRNGASNLLSPIGISIKRLLNGLHGEVGMTTIDAVIFAFSCKTGLYLKLENSIIP